MLMVVVTVVMMSVNVESSQTLLKDMTKNFLKAYGQCQKEVNQFLLFLVHKSSSFLFIAKVYLWKIQAWA